MHDAAVEVVVTGQDALDKLIKRLEAKERELPRTEDAQNCGFIRTGLHLAIYEAKGLIHELDEEKLITKWNSDWMR